MNSFTFLVTGAAGFIGSNLVQALLDGGHKVVAFDNLSLGSIDNLAFVGSHSNQNYRFIQGDIVDFDACLEACEGVDFVLHQAALGSVPRSMKEPLFYHHNNVTGTVNMLLASIEKGVKRFVYASSSSVYGNTPTLPKIETMKTSPLSPYAVSKLTCESYASAYYNAYGLPTIGLRYFNVFGPRQNPNSQYAAVIPKFVTSYLNNESPTIHGDGGQTRDFTFVSNVVKANLNACLSAPEEAFGLSFNIGCGGRISVKHLSDSIRSQLGATAEAIHTETRAGDVRDSLASIELSQRLLDYNDLVPLEQGLKITLDWYKEIGS